MTQEHLEKLSKPPINEVVCGVFFEAIPQLDPLVLGTYWNERKSEYPHREVKPALREDNAIIVGAVPPLRVWLIDKNDQFVIQIQQDRFYVNWRKRAEAYPSFSGRDGNRGVLAAVLEEYARFTEFCLNAVGVSPTANKIELAKVDVFTEGNDTSDGWRGLPDLATMLPWLTPFAAFDVAGTPQFVLRFDEHRTNGLLTVSMGLGSLGEPNTVDKRAVKLETRVITSSSADTGGIEAAFRAANDELNAVFSRLIPKEERTRRFKWGAT